jgi:hypothetical protein
MDSRQKRFRVALSFPGEHREFVNRVAERLSERLGRERVLYDAYYEAEFARIDLDTYLQRLYHDESDLIAVFISAHYERKEWCGLEWRAIRDIIKQRRESTVVPVRFDNTEIPGLFSTSGYIWVGDREPEDIADLILQRLDLEHDGVEPITSTAPPATVSPPSTPVPRPSAALDRWREKLAYLLSEEAVTVDPDQKFRLRHLIDEARAKIREHEGES